MIRKTVLLVVAVLLLVGLISITDCTSNNEEGQDFPPLLEPPDKGNPKLGSHLNQLLQAKGRGEAEEFARQYLIELVDGSVKVIIECDPGQAEAVAEAASQVGAEQVKSRKDLIQALVPITKLTTLADIPGVHRVRLPIHPVEND